VGAVLPTLKHTLVSISEKNRETLQEGRFPGHPASAGLPTWSAEGKRWELTTS
jgi:hypothetical protein